MLQQCGKYPCAPFILERIDTHIAAAETANLCHNLPCNFILGRRYREGAQGAQIFVRHLEHLGKDVCRSIHIFAYTFPLPRRHIQRLKHIGRHDHAVKADVVYGFCLSV